MTTLLEIALVNAVLTAILASVVFVITRIWKNPHLAHILWLIVLLKMVTPPLVRVPISFGFERNGGDIAAIAQRGLSSPLLTPSSATEQDGDLISELAVGPTGLIKPSVEMPSESTVGHETSTRSTNTATRALWPFYVGMVWLCGSLLYVIIAGVRIIRFHRKLKGTDVAGGNLHRIGKSVAYEIGLKQTPELRVAHGHLSPMVWPIGRPLTVILPNGLVENLPEEQLKTIVAHEYGHIFRRDHWVRWLEVVCTTLQWWNPCLWLVRREIRIAEELCCDALVVKNYPGVSKSFGEALLKVADFLSDIPHEAPILVSEIRGAGQMKRRIEMVLKGQNSRRISGIAKGVLLILTLAILPLSAQDSQNTQQNAAVEKKNFRNLQYIGLAFHNYHDVHKKFPTAASYDSEGKPLLSWRVHILPYLGEKESKLYQQFRLDEPWNGPHNRTLVSEMPDVFKVPLAEPLGDTLTSYLLPVSNKTAFPPKGEGRSMTDLSSNTILVVEADRAQAVVWSEPKDLEYNADVPSKGLGGQRKDGFLAVFADGRVDTCRSGLDANQLRKLFNPQDGTKRLELPRPREVLEAQVQSNTEVKVQPDRLTLGTVQVGATLEASVRFFMHIDKLSGVTSQVASPEFIKVTGTEVGTKSRGHAGTLRYFDVFISIDTSQPGSFSGAVVVEFGTHRSELPVTVKVIDKEPAARHVLIVSSPFTGTSTDDAAHYTSFLEVVRSSKLDVNYTRYLPRQLSSFDVILLTGRALAVLDDMRVQSLNKYIRGGGRVIVAANAFFLGSVTRANELLEGHGLILENRDIHSTAKKPQDRSRFESKLVTRDKLTADVSLLKFRRASPIKVITPSMAKILVHSPFSESEGTIAVSRPGEGEIVVLSQSIWWLWAGRGGDNAQMLRNLFVVQ